MCLYRRTWTCTINYSASHNTGVLLMSLNKERLIALSKVTELFMRWNCLHWLYKGKKDNF